MQKEKLSMHNKKLLSKNLGADVYYMPEDSKSKPWFEENIAENVKLSRQKKSDDKQPDITN